MMYKLEIIPDRWLICTDLVEVGNLKITPKFWANDTIISKICRGFAFVTRLSELS